MAGGDSMDTISLDEWELLPDLGSSFFMEECTAGDEEEVMKPPVQAASAQQQQQHAVEFKDIGVVQAEPRRGELASKVTEVMVSNAEEEEEIVNVKSPAAEKEVCDEDEVMVEAVRDHLPHEVEEGVERDRAGLECSGFSVGKLRVNGVGALCSFGVAAATLCIFVLGGRPQQQQQQRKIMVQDQKSQFQMYADDERTHRAVEQASRLNQAVSSVMGGASTRATVSFGGYYDGF